MRASQVGRAAFAGSLIVFGIGLAIIPTASADPADTGQTESATPAPAATEACQQFSDAMNYAASNYEDFAYATAGEGNIVNYADPSVSSSNVVGRTALREAAAATLRAAGTSGLQPEIAGPMQSWSLDAAKLLVIMGVHGGGDALNSAATDLNTDSHNVQLACAAAGTPA